MTVVVMAMVACHHPPRHHHQRRHHHPVDVVVDVVCLGWGVYVIALVMTHVALSVAVVAVMVMCGW